jgi:hypothetical protein
MSASTTSDHSALNLSVTYFGTAVTSATFPLEYLPTRSRPIPYSPLPPCLLQADLAISSLGLPIYFLIRTHTRFARPQRVSQTLCVSLQLPASLGCRRQRLQLEEVEAVRALVRLNHALTEIHPE